MNAQTERFTLTGAAGAIEALRDRPVGTPRGVAVIAHPWSRGTREVLTAPYLESLVTTHGLEGIEVDHPDHDEDTRSLLFEMGARLGLIRTGSSDYHGTGKKRNPLGANLTRPSAFRDLTSRIKRRGGVA